MITRQFRHYGISIYKTITIGFKFLMYLNNNKQSPSDLNHCITIMFFDNLNQTLLVCFHYKYVWFNECVGKR